MIGRGKGWEEARREEQQSGKGATRGGRERIKKGTADGMSLWSEARSSQRRRERARGCGRRGEGEVHEPDWLDQV